MILYDEIELEVLKALEQRPCRIKEIKFSKSKATLYRALARLIEENYIEAIENRNYALTAFGRRALELFDSGRGATINKVIKASRG